MNRQKEDNCRLRAVEISRRALDLKVKASLLAWQAERLMRAPEVIEKVTRRFISLGSKLPLPIKILLLNNKNMLSLRRASEKIYPLKKNLLMNLFLHLDSHPLPLSSLEKDLSYLPKVAKIKNLIIAIPNEVRRANIQRILLNSHFLNLLVSLHQAKSYPAINTHSQMRIAR